MEQRLHFCIAAEMHELSIALSLIDAASEEIAQHPGARVAALHLRVGAWSGVVADALRFSFEVAAAGTPIEGARLDIESTVGRDLELRALELVGGDEPDDDIRPDDAHC